MSWMRVGVPLLVGLVAVGLNYAALSRKAPTGAFTRVNAAVPAGTRLSDDVLEKVEFSASADDLKELRRTALPWSERQLAIGTPVLRDMAKNDLVLLRDVATARGELKEPGLPISLDGLNVVPTLLRVGDQVGFLIAAPKPPRDPKAAPSLPVPDPQPELKLIGPFRVLSVGDLVNRQGPDFKEPRGSSERIITVAVKLRDKHELDDPNISRLLAAQRGDSTGRSRIYGIVLMPTSVARP